MIQGKIFLPTHVIEISCDQMEWHDGMLQFYQNGGPYFYCHFDRIIAIEGLQLMNHITRLKKQNAPSIPCIGPIL